MNSPLRKIISENVLAMMLKQALTERMHQQQVSKNFLLYYVGVLCTVHTDLM